MTCSQGQSESSKRSPPALATASAKRELTIGGVHCMRPAAINSLSESPRSPCRVASCPLARMAFGSAAAAHAALSLLRELEAPKGTLREDPVMSRPAEDMAVLPR